MAWVRLLLPGIRFEIPGPVNFLNRSIFVRYIKQGLGQMVYYFRLYITVSRRCFFQSSDFLQFAISILNLCGTKRNGADRIGFLIS